MAASSHSRLGGRTSFAVPGGVGNAPTLYRTETRETRPSMSQDSGAFIALGRPHLCGRV